MNSVKDLEKRVKALEERNRRVESDKAWETSNTRKLIIAVFTYLAIALYLYTISVPLPWLNAIVPTVGFLLSTLTLPFFRRIWLGHVHKKEK
jgi:ABC-type bacteriocin/lantibiotic exporter with double-glycine peptidase domain